jgi:2-phosphosulfolactate phosphatase
MSATLEVLFAPAEFEALPRRDLSDTVCVVFDVFRATSTIVTALANGAAAIIPIAEIADALTLRRQHPDILLAGERDGLRIHAGMTGGIEFDFGNSPREFTAARVKGRTIALTTTNGSRALRACAPAKEVLVGSFLNLAATAAYLRRNPAPNLLLVCSGTGREASYEDLLGVGALADLIWTEFDESGVADSAWAAWELYKNNRLNLLNAAADSRNGRRLRSIPDLRDDVPWCLDRDRFPLVAKLNGDSVTTLP